MNRFAALERPVTEARPWTDFSPIGWLFGLVTSLALWVGIVVSPRPAWMPMWAGPAGALLALGVAVLCVLGILLTIRRDAALTLTFTLGMGSLLIGTSSDWADWAPVWSGSAFTVAGLVLICGSCTLMFSMISRRLMYLSFVADGILVWGLALTQDRPDWAPVWSGWAATAIGLSVVFGAVTWGLARVSPRLLGPCVVAGGLVIWVVTLIAERPDWAPLWAGPALAMISGFLIGLGLGMSLWRRNSRTDT